MTMSLFFYFMVFLGIVFAPGSHGQGLVKETTNGSTVWQPWLVGLTAVMVFLFVMFVANLIHRVFFSHKKGDRDQMENLEIQPSAEENAYENKAMDPEEGNSETKI